MDEDFCSLLLLCVPDRAHMLSFICLFAKEKRKGNPLYREVLSHLSLTFSRLLVATKQLDCLGPNEVQRQFPALGRGVHECSSSWLWKADIKENHFN